MVNKVFFRKREFTYLSGATCDSTFCTLEMDEYTTDVTIPPSSSDDEYTDYEYTPYIKQPAAYIVPALFLLIFVIGVLGNGILLMVFLRHKSMRTAQNTFIFSLSLGALLVLLSCVPFQSIIFTLDSWPWGVALCKICEATKCIFIGVSVFTLTALAAERYSVIANPLKEQKIESHTVLKAVLIWLLAIGLSIPDAIVTNVESLILDYNSTLIVDICSPFPVAVSTMYRKYNIAAKALIFYIGPLCVITFCYTMMAIKLKTSANRMPRKRQGKTSLQVRSRRNISKMILCFTFLFFICFLPHHVFLIWFYFHPTVIEDYNNFWHVFGMVGFCLSYLNSCLNPVALYCGSSVYKKYINRYLFCNSCNRAQNPAALSTGEVNLQLIYLRS